MTLQHKLLLVALGTLLLPVAGWLYLRQMDQVLRQSQEQSLLASAQVLARVMASSVHLPQAQSWHVQRNSLPIVIDGYADDWTRMASWNQAFPGHGKLLLAEHAGWLYLLMSVTDVTHNRLGAEQNLAAADHLEMALGMHGAICRYQLASMAPGFLKARPQKQAPSQCPNPLRAQWQENGSGYQLEIRLPPAAAVGYLGLRAHDADKPDSQSVQLYPLQRFSQALSRQLAGLVPAARRVRLLNASGWLVADAGQLASPAPRDAPGWLSTLIYGSLVSQGMDGSPVLGQVTPRVDAAEVWQALSGLPATSWRSSVARGRVTLAAVVPLPGRGDPRGVLLLEQSSRTMPLLVKHGLLWLLLGSLALLLLAGALLIVFALRLGARLRLLRDATERVAAHEGHGLMDAPLPLLHDADELGDLARSYHGMLDAVAGYTDYLHSLAARLSHEINTPLAIVKTSLDNLDQAELADDIKPYLQRARDGSNRLAALVRAMGAASRVELAIASAEAEDFDLRALVAGCADGYRLLAGARQFQLDLPSTPVSLHGAPDLIVQALDKLFDNELSFTPDNGWMRMALDVSEDGAVIEMANQGPLLPQDMMTRLFDSLVSVRKAASSDSRPHLGLGLYIVRLIAAQHGGSICARNLDTADGVTFCLQLRGMPRQSLAAPAATAAT